MGGRGGSRKPEVMDAFHFSRDDPSLFWDTAVPALFLEKGMPTDGVRLYFPVSVCTFFLLIFYFFPSCWNQLCSSNKFMMVQQQPLSRILRKRSQLTTPTPLIPLESL